MSGDDEKIYHSELLCGRTRYEYETDQYRDQIYHEALVEKEAFRSAIKAFNCDDQQQSSPPESDWDAVLETARKAQVDAEVDAIKGPGGAIRNLTRRLGDAGPAFKAWLQVLPTDSYGSVICGGFNVIIDAAIRHKELCEKVFGALGDIPEVIANAKFSFNEYKSEALYKRVAKLYTVITETLNGILSFYKGRASGRHFRAARNALKALGKGSDYGRAIEAHIDNVKSSADAVKQEAERCLHHRLGEIQATVEYQTLKLACSQRINQNVYASLQYQMKCFELQWRESQAANIALRNEVTCIRRAVTPKPSPRYGPSPRKIGQLLQTSPSIAVQDLGEVLREAQSFPVHLQTQANQFMTSQELQEWLTSPDSSALLAQGSDGDEKISALSFVASLLVQSFQACKDAVPLYFYCALHTDPFHDGLSGAVGMMQQLAAQLLLIEQHDLDLEFIHRKFIQAIDNGDVGALCDLFKGLIQQLPQSTTIFLVVDGMSFYETRDRLKDTCHAMSRLLELVEKAKPVFKFLITSPGASAHVSKGLRPEQVYWLPEIDPEEDEGFSYNVGVFKDQAGVQARTSQMGLMRSDSEWFENP
ncbi:MAG: hypothetical protein LQ346_004502 [Caloplaca aetnensis]|nr:MAG: hypothetical protein LQ346_004502 [Caloplaca aetnensis]